MSQELQELQDELRSIVARVDTILSADVSLPPYVARELDNAYAALYRAYQAFRNEGKPFVPVHPTPDELPTTPNSLADFLTEAQEILIQRGNTYEAPEGERSMAKTVRIFNAFHATALTETQGWHFMAVLKQVRAFARPQFHRDSFVDNVNYSLLMTESKAREGV